MKKKYIKQLIELVLKGHDYQIVPYYSHSNKPNHTFNESNIIYIAKISEVGALLFLQDNLIKPLNENIFYIFDSCKSNQNLTIQGYCIKTNDKILLTKLLSEYFYKG